MLLVYTVHVLLNLRTSKSTRGNSQLGSRKERERERKKERKKEKKRKKERKKEREKKRKWEYGIKDTEKRGWTKKG